MCEDSLSVFLRGRLSPGHNIILHLHPLPFFYYKNFPSQHLFVNLTPKDIGLTHLFVNLTPKDTGTPRSKTPPPNPNPLPQPDPAPNNSNFTFIRICMKKDVKIMSRISPCPVTGRCRKYRQSVKMQNYVNNYVDDNRRIYSVKTLQWL